MWPRATLPQPSTGFCCSKDNCTLPASLTGGGLVFWHANGGMVRHQIETFWKDLHMQVGTLCA